MSIEEQVIRVYERNREDVYRYLVLTGVRPEQAQESTQEAFLRLWTALRAGNEILNPRAWVFRVAHNLGIDQLKAGHGDTPLAPGLEQMIPDTASSAEQILLRGERAARLRDALDGLSPQQRQCLHLRAEGFRYHEIAGALGIGISTVGEFLTRAVDRLKRAVHD